MDANKTVLLRVQLDEGKTEQRLQSLVLDIEKTRTAQTALNAARKQGMVTDEEFAKASVNLKNQLRAQQQEQTALTKNLELFRTAVNGVDGSYKQSQAQLSLAQKQYQELSGSAKNSTQETLALSKVIDELRGTLKVTDAGMGLFVRGIGQYPKLSADAQMALSAMSDELQSLKGYMSETAKAGGPISSETIQRVQQLESELADAKLANTEYGDSVVDLKQKLSDLTAARDLSQEKERVQELNAAILETRGALQEATGKVDEFGDKIEKNAKKEDLATLSDAFGGVTAAIQLSTLAALDEEDAAEATAKATQFLAQAEAARNFQIGLASARDAAHIVFLKAKNLLFTEGAALTMTTTAATVAGTAATTAQAAATGGATVAQRALNLAMTANPLGLLVVAVGLVVGALFAFANASETTQRKVQNFFTLLLRFGTPVGLVVTGVEALYKRFQAVRDILDPVGRKLDSLATKLQPVKEFFVSIADRAAESGRSIGEYIGLLDTAAEKAAKNSARALEQAEKEAESYKLRARQVELAGGAIEQFRSTEREGLLKSLAAIEENNKRQEEALKQELKRIDQKVIANEALTSSEQKIADERREREDKLKAAQIALTEFDLTTQAQIEARTKATAAARKKELDEAKSAAERAKKLAEQELKDQFVARKLLLQNRQEQIARLLDVVEKGSEQEQHLLREQARNATNIQLADNSAAQVGVLKKQESALLAARKEIIANGQAELRKLEEQHLTDRINRAFDIAATGNATLLAQAREGSSEELRLKQEAIALQLDQDIQAIDKRKSQKEQEAEKDRLRAVAARETANNEYAFAQQRLEDFFTDREQAVERDFAQGQLTEKQYQQRLYEVQKARVEASKLLNQDYHRDNAELLQKENQLNTEQTARYKAEIQQRIQAGQAFGEQVGEIFAESLTQQGDALAAFTTQVLLLVLDMLESQLKAQVASAVGIATVGSLSSQQSIATAGIAGFAQAALLTAAISAAFGVAKGLIRSSLTPSSSAKFAGGTVLGGAPHEQGGTQLFAPNGQHWGEAEQNEMVLTKGVYLNPTLRTMANQLNMLGGGRNLLNRPEYSMPKMALGSTLTSLPSTIASPLVRESLRGNTPPIDYDKLAASMAKVNIYTKTQEMMSSMEKIKYTKNIGSD
ncbi:hypothetical protein [Hymenobacter cellulosivorans]|uniref:Phage tail tape measure protein n=1 Tax=Hymenobacter cellulosivorans TaxID=2932249 RepID=A0ABY4FAL0_9BACT|nr:hypothetical protein [Hymenobacter cellulosivorans]UOQ53057.1 hypothetical protein MUN80_25385 [Hymenobacter cellulosivorans]